SWDIAVKRPLIRVNSGDSGPGSVSTAFLPDRSFADVGSADIANATFSTERWFDAECNAQTDPSGAVKTTFFGWYDYDQQSHALSPHTGTFLVRDGQAHVFKLAIETYYAEADGGIGTSGGHLRIKLALL